MYEVFVLVEKKRSVLMQFLTVFCLVLTLLSVLATILLIPLFMTFALLFGVLTWFFKTRCAEYEYSYFDGEVRFAKILNKSRRKRIGIYSMDEVLMIAPSGDRSVYNYEKNSNLEVKNLTSGNKDAKVYIMVAKGASGQELIKFEPDEKFLDAVCVKYAQKVKK